MFLLQYSDAGSSPEFKEFDYLANHKSASTKQPIRLVFDSKDNLYIAYADANQDDCPEVIMLNSADYSNWHWLNSDFAGLWCDSYSGQDGTMCRTNSSAWSQLPEEFNIVISNKSGIEALYLVKGYDHSSTVNKLDVYTYDINKGYFYSQHDTLSFSPNIEDGSHNIKAPSLLIGDNGDKIINYISNVNNSDKADHSRLTQYVNGTLSIYGSNKYNVEGNTTTAAILASNPTPVAGVTAYMLTKVNNQYKVFIK